MKNEKDLFQMVNIEYKNVTINIFKVNKSKHVQIYLLLHLVLTHFSECSDFLHPENIVSKEYKMRTWGIKMELNNTPFLYD